MTPLSEQWPEGDDIQHNPHLLEGTVSFRAYAIIVICLLLVRVARKDAESGALFPRKPAWPCSCLTGMRSKYNVHVIPRVVVRSTMLLCFTECVA